MNKVTFIYAHEPSEEWSTPLSLIHEFEERGWETGIVSIGSNRTGIYHDRDLKNWIDSKPTTDMVVFMDWGRFDSPYLDKELIPNAFWVQESGDDPQNFVRNSPKANRFHFTFTPDYESCLKYLNMEIDCWWSNHWADTRVQYPMDVEIKYLATTTRGPGGSAFLDALTQHGGGMIGNKNGLNAIEHSQFLQSGLMVVQNSRHGEITRRLFEAAACGKMILTDRLVDIRNIDSIFTEKENIVYYDDLSDCIELINYYAENHEERERIAKNGMELVLENHTQKNIVDKLIIKRGRYLLNG